MRISVCIATYNGEKYIHAQIASILPQLGSEDEIIVSDDSSTDRTVEIIKAFNDPRISILEHQQFRSHVYNFENALRHAQGEYIFLSDQDDIWLPEKVETMLSLLSSYDLVLSDAWVVNEKEETIHDSFFQFNHSRKGLMKNLYKNSYLGCCMAFNRSILNIALPFPKNINMHDWWIGLIAEIYGSVCFTDKKLILYRRHGDAVTPTDRKSTNPLLKKIGFRIAMVRELLSRILTQLWYYFQKCRK